MPDAAPVYTVREQTGDFEHASVDDVVDLVLQRAQNPRTDYEDAHVDRVVVALVDKYGMESVRTVIHRVLVDNEPFRTATNCLELCNVDGVRIGTAAMTYRGRRRDGRYCTSSHPGWFVNRS